MSIIGENGLKGLQQQFQEVPLTNPCEGGRLVTVEDGLGTGDVTHRDLFRAHIMALRALLVVGLAEAVLPEYRGHTGSRSGTLRGKRTFDIMEGLWAKALGHSGLGESEDNSVIR